MLLNVAHNLMLPAATYQCQWTYRDREVPGEMRLEALQTPAGALFDAPGTWDEAENSKTFIPHSDDVEVLRGWVRRGYEAVLLNARVQHWWPGNSRVSANMALVGARLPDELVFHSVEFQVGGLTELAGAYPLKSVDPPYGLGPDQTVTVAWNTETASQEWTTSAGDKLELEFAGGIERREGYSFTITSSPLVTASGAPRSATEWMRQYVRPLAQITTLATLRPQPVSWVVLRHGDKEFPVQLFAGDIAQQPYDAAPTELSQLISHSSGTLIRVGPDGATLPDLLDGWQSLQTTYITFFDYLTAALRDSMSVKSRFLALVPALEGFHLAKYGDGPIPRKEFAKRRKTVLQRITALDGVDQDDAEFIREWLHVYGSYQLAHRLRDLIARELGEGLRQRVRAEADVIPAILSNLVNQPEDVWAVMGTARNRIAHGLDNQPSTAQLVTLTRLAHTVAIGIALNHLGVPDAVLCAAIDQD